MPSTKKQTKAKSTICNEYDFVAELKLYDVHKMKVLDNVMFAREEKKLSS